MRANTDGLSVRFTTRKWPPTVGGMETYSLRMSEELGRLCRLDTVALPGRRDGRAPSALSLLAFGVLSALRLPFRRRVNVALLGDMAIWPIGLLEFGLGKAAALVISAHGSDVSFAARPGWRSKLYAQYLRLGAKLVPSAAIIANSGYVADLARSAGFGDVSVVPLATDLAGTASQPRDGLLFAGRITRSKGLRFLVEQVMPLLPKTVVLKVAGTIWDDGERELLDHPGVHYLGPLSPASLAEEFSKAQVTVIPSLVAEGFGLVAIEAAACGCAVVASRGGGLSDIVAAPWGDLVEPGDAKAWAEAILARLRFPAEEVERNATAAAKEVGRSYRWSRVAERTHAILKARSDSAIAAPACSELGE